MNKSGKLGSEQEFHDRWAAEIEVARLEVDRLFEGSTAPENRFLLKHLGDLRGKRILDVGCGLGESSVYLAKQGALVMATDLSPGMIATTERLAEHHGVELATEVCEADSQPFSDEIFDVVYSANTLHHVDPEKTLLEFRRLVKKGGMVATFDPLRHNPVINLYRRMATEVRTPDESPLDIRIVEFVKQHFAEVVFDTFWYATLLVFLRFFLLEHIHPNRERYWKKIITEEPRLRKFYQRLEKIDNIVKRWPGVSRFGWNLALIARK